VKAQLDWQGPAGFDDEIEIAVIPTRLGTKSFDLEYRATVEGRPVCTGVVTYVSVKPGAAESVEIPPDVRTAFEEAKA
jgi:acyl-CoA thioesterase FadM